MKCACELVFYDLNDREKKDYWMHSINESSLLNNRLWELNRELGVDAYLADDVDFEATLQWRLRGHWYTTSQIERIMKIRAFL